MLTLHQMLTPLGIRWPLITICCRTSWYSGWDKAWTASGWTLSLTRSRTRTSATSLCSTRTKDWRTTTWTTSTPRACRRRMNCSGTGATSLIPSPRLRINQGDCSKPLCFFFRFNYLKHNGNISAPKFQDIRKSDLSRFFKISHRPIHLVNYF